MHAITSLVLIWNVKYQLYIRVIYQIVRMIQPFHSGLVANVVSVSATPFAKFQLGSFVVVSLSHSVIRVHPCVNGVLLKSEASTHIACKCQCYTVMLPSRRYLKRHGAVQVQKIVVGWTMISVNTECSGK